MNRSEKAVIEWECVAVLYRSYAYLDASQHEDLIAQIAPGAQIQRNESTVVVGPAGMRANLAQRSRDRQTRHLVVGPRVEVLSIDKATVHYVVMSFSGAPGSLSGMFTFADGETPLLRGAAVACDRMVRIDDQWRISGRTYAPAF